MNYLNLITKTETFSENEINGINCRTMYTVGDNFVIEVTLIQHDRKNMNDLANLWVKYGDLDRFLPTTVHIDTCYTDSEGRSYIGKYNIQLTRDGKKIDLRYMLEATQENIDYLLSECIRLYEMDIE